jgi:hypothetical protein
VRCRGPALAASTLAPSELWPLLLHSGTLPRPVSRGSAVVSAASRSVQSAATRKRPSDRRERHCVRQAIVRRLASTRWVPKRRQPRACAAVRRGGDAARAAMAAMGAKAGKLALYGFAAVGAAQATYALLRTTTKVTPGLEERRKQAGRSRVTAPAQYLVPWLCRRPERGRRRPLCVCCRCALAVVTRLRWAGMAVPAAVADGEMVTAGLEAHLGNNLRSLVLDRQAAAPGGGSSSSAVSTASVLVCGDGERCGVFRSTVMLMGEKAELLSSTLQECVCATSYPVVPMGAWGYFTVSPGH